MINFLKNIFGYDVRAMGVPRASKWPEVRKVHLIREPICQVCGTKKNLQVHHKKSFATHPELELQDSNLITLCEGMESNCHRMFGHLNSWRSINDDIDKDVSYFQQKIKNRPSWNGKGWIYLK